MHATPSRMAAAKDARSHHGPGILPGAKTGSWHIPQPAYVAARIRMSESAAQPRWNYFEPGTASTCNSWNAVFSALASVTGNTAHTSQR